MGCRKGGERPAKGALAALNEGLQQQIAELKKELHIAREENKRLLDTQVKLGEVTNNYLMLHYLNKNVHECRTTQKLWETYIHNIADKGFNYKKVWVLTPGDAGMLDCKMYLQNSNLTLQYIDPRQLDGFILAAIESKASNTSADNTSAAIPIVNNYGDVKGVLVVEKAYGITFEDIELLDVYAQQTVSTIENVTLNEKLIQYQDLLGQKLDQFVLLHYVSKEIHDTGNYYDVLEKYLRVSMSPVGFHFRESALYIVTERSWEKAVIAGNRLVMEPVSAMGDISQLVLGAWQEKVYQMDPSLRRLAFPLLAEGRVFAIMEIFHDTVITEEQVQTFEIFAMQTSSVLENRRLKLLLEGANEKLLRISMIDGLTGVFNRRRFDQVLEAQWRRSLTSSRPLSLIILDVDCFKSYNDTYGHLAGDQVLKQIAATLNAFADGQENLTARYGGEEFVVLLTDGGRENAVDLANSVRIAIEKLEIENKNSTVGPYLTVSMGVCCMIPSRQANAVDLILGADAALYRAKTTGRNRVEMAQ